MQRVFLGIDLPAELKDKIEGLKQKAELNRLPLKLVEPANSHIAVKFFGELTDEQIVQINGLVNESIGGFKSFNCLIKDVLLFPNFYSPRVLSLKVESKNLEGLATKLFNEFDKIDFIDKETRKYVPHITLGRFKEGLSEIELKKIASLKFGAELTVNRLQLFASELTASGPIYRIIETFELK
ncbi:MAG TPA: RNA 2',3'-cyclic phosphodiesterase [Patescibacteria group bacterium]|nr:RNA 2',3'-cyclic phosphodiesterase [Patescibacteria group bacterium]